MPSEPSPGERWEQVSHLYHAALARPAPQRRAFRREAAAGNETLGQEVASMLAYENAAGVLDHPAALAGETIPVVDAESDDLIGRDIGGYHVTSRLGAGGMGIVYKAVDSKFQRPVAIKVLSTAVADPA